MKNIKNRFIKITYPLFFIIVIFILAIIGCFAVYTNQGYEKGVAITDENIAMFSSNVLGQIPNKNISSSDQYDIKQSYIIANDLTGSFSFSVSNYAPNSPNRINTSDIIYDLQVEIISPLSLTDFSSFKLGDTSFTSSTMTLSNQTLVHGEAHTIDYTITMPIDLVSQRVYFKITAIPTSNTLSATSNTCLAAIVYPRTYDGGQVNISGWNGRWIEANLTGVKPSDCIAFNYEIYGNGSGQITLTVPACLTIDPFFLIGKTWDNVNKTLTFDVNSDTQSVYNIRFYRNETALSNGFYEDSFSNWSSLIIYKEDGENINE